MNSAPPVAPKTPRPGGLARYFVDHREVGWIALVAVLLWGLVSYFQLAQQEDPDIPHRTAQLVTTFPGANSAKIADLVTRKLEDKIDELDCVEELKSQSRAGVSIITIKQVPASKARIEQEWEKLRARLKEAELPEGCGEPRLNTDFGNTVTLLFGITSPPQSDAEIQARAGLIRSRLADLRTCSGSDGRAAVFAMFPPAVSADYRADLRRKFETQLRSTGLADDVRFATGPSYDLADFKTAATRGQLESFLAKFIRSLAGSDAEMHPDFSGAGILMGGEDPLPAVRASAPPRYSYRELEVAADRLMDTLKQAASVGKVRKIGEAREVVDLFFSIAAVNGYNFSPDEVLRAIAARNAIIPGGTFRAEGQNFPVQLSGEFRDENEMLGAVVAADSRTGLPVYLRDLFEVRRGYETPIPYSADVLARDAAAGSVRPAPLTSHRAVLLAVEMKEGRIIGSFEKEVLASVDRVRAGLPDGMQILVLSDQPQAVAHRVAHFMRCFIESVVIVVLVALFLMDWRAALVVAAAIPLTVALTLGGMAIFGIPLHQISIAALIIALGMLVDDPVVASDAINRELAHGQPRETASWLGPFNLRHAILFGTLINIVAFLPLALLPGDKGAFIFALPVVVTLALAASRMVSVTFIPLLGYYLLRGQKGLEAGGEVRSFPLFALVDRALIRVLPHYRRLLRAALDHPFRTVAIAYGLLAASFGLAGLLGTQFFPPAERNQLLIDIQLPESASITQTHAVCRQVEEILKQHENVASAVVFSGGTAPRFYYNVVPAEPASYLAQVLINTRRDRDVPELLVALRAELDREIAGARCVVKQLEQGPAVETPIQVRITGDDPDELRRLADAVAGQLRAAGGYKVHDDLGRRVPALQIDIDQERANTLGINNDRIGRIAQAAFHGLKVTELREGDHLVPVYVRLRVEDRNEAEKVQSLYVRSLNGSLVPLGNFANVNLKPEYATLAHYGKLRSVTVKSYSAFDELPSAVLKRARPGIEALPLPWGYRIEFAGEAKELRQSRSEMGRVMAISLSLIAIAMVIQFNSGVKSLVVMLTVPLGLIGALGGLAITGSSIGFMALLGMVSLAGVIVSHIIVLSDFIEHARAAGMPLRDALVEAGLVRLRAVLVTVLATVGGLIPLALTGGALWHALTAVHIFGLLFATLLTLVVLPVLYFIFCDRLRWIR
ncbi:MAG: efflux RND transporter permease subunit [Verrucomicrobiota bacterium]